MADRVGVGAVRAAIGEERRSSLEHEPMRRVQITNVHVEVHLLGVFGVGPTWGAVVVAFVEMQPRAPARPAADQRGVEGPELHGALVGAHDDDRPDALELLCVERKARDHVVGVERDRDERLTRRAVECEAGPGRVEQPPTRHRARRAGQLLDCLPSLRLAQVRIQPTPEAFRHEPVEVRQVAPVECLHHGDREPNGICHSHER